MSDMDDLLQNQLEAIERGKPLKAVLDELPKENAELVDMIQIAHTVRDLHHPQPSKKTHPARGWSAGSLASRFPRWRFDWLQARPAMMVSGVVLSALVLLVAFVSILGIGLWINGPRYAQAATLMGISGQVEVASSATTADWHLVSDGYKLVEGQRVRTGADSTATLVFYEGSRAVMEPYTDLTLSTVEGGWGRSLRVVLDQRMGDTTHSVVPFSGSDSLYYVQTPAGTASVHGTVFSVDVDLNGQARFAVDSGEVRVSGQSSDVWLVAGQTTAVQPGLAPSIPSYQFEVSGEIQEAQGKIWAVNGVYFDVASLTYIEGSPQVGDSVEVKGRVLSSGALVADHIEAATLSDPQASFTGKLESMEGNLWIASGLPVYVGENTDLDNDLAEGDPVEMVFAAQANGTWLALNVASLDEDNPGLINDAGLTLTKSASPTQYTEEGDVISYTFEISNTGTVVIEGPFEVYDDKTTDESCPATPTSLAPGESILCSAHYTVSADDLVVRSVTNTAYATGTFSDTVVTSNTDSETVNALLPMAELTLDKSANPTYYTEAGEVISYTYRISNTGTVVVDGPFAVSDDKTMDESCPGTPTSLAPGEAITCESHYTITENDLVDGSVTNVASATGAYGTATVISNTDSETVYMLQPNAELTITKTASPMEFDAVGDVISYTYEVMNTGNVTVDGPFVVDDDKTTDESCPDTPTSLAPGESIICSAHYEITGDDLNAGSVTNVAFVTGFFSDATVTSNTDTVTVNSTLVTDCTGADPHPKGQKLADEYGVPYAEIMGWFCQRFGFGEIDLAYGLAEAYGVTPEQLFELRRTGLGWGQIKNMLKQGLIAPSETTPPTDTETPVEPKKNGPPAEKNKPEPPGKQKKSNNSNSNGQSLAQRYGVTYDAIMGWYNAGYSFSDINQAYSLSRAYNVPVETIFDRRAAGMNWGQIRQELRNKPSKKP